MSQKIKQYFTYSSFWTNHPSWFRFHYCSPVPDCTSFPLEHRTAIWGEVFRVPYMPWPNEFSSDLILTIYDLILVVSLYNRESSLKVVLNCNFYANNYTWFVLGTSNGISLIPSLLYFLMHQLRIFGSRILQYLWNRNFCFRSSSHNVFQQVPVIIEYS